MTITATPLALRLFTDRDEPREVLRRFFQHIKDGAIGASDDARPILSFYGVGGVGKSALLAKALDDFAAAEQADLYEIEQRHLRAAVVDLDVGTITHDVGIERVMVRVRNRLNAQGLSTPHFDYLYALWVSEEQPEQGIQLPANLAPSAATLDDQLSAWDALSRLAGFLGETIPGANTVRQGLSGLKKLQAWVERSRIRIRFADGLPMGWPQRLRLERMPALLAFDLLGAISHQPQLALCLAVDGFERVQTRHHAHDAQWALQSLLAEVLDCTDLLPAPDGKLLKGRIGFLFLGRERLRWAELYSREPIHIPWSKVMEERCELCGLAETDARSFLLDRVVPHERAEKRDKVAEIISRHVDALLAAACEHRPDEAPSYLPYYLDLGVALVRNNAAFFQPTDFGSTPAELQARFLRSLPLPHRAAFRALALTLEFDADTFAFLLDKGELTGFSRNDFSTLVGDDWSFVTPLHGTPGVFRFHRHMQAALLADQTGRSEDRATATRIFRAVFRRQTDLITFTTPAECGPANLAALDRATAQLREVAAYRADAREPSLLPVEEIVAEARALNLRFDSEHHLEHRRPILEWVVTLATDALGEEHPDSLAATNHLAEMLRIQGEFKRSRALHEQGLATRQRVLGVEHPDTLTSTNNLALALRAQGDLAGARALQEQVLAVRRRLLSDEHQDTLTSMNNLAGTLRAQGDLAGARALQEQTLTLRRRVLGEEHPKTLTSCNNLAGTLKAQGDLAGARMLQEQVLAVRRRVLGNEHPKTLTSVNNLATTLRAQGDLNGARALHEHTLTLRRRVLGDEHPKTLTSINNLATACRELGDLAGARGLQEQALAIRRRLLGDEHPKTLTSINNLATTLRAQGDLTGARALYEHALALRRRVLGDKHPSTTISAWQLLNTIDALGDTNSAKVVRTRHLEWLVTQDPASLGADIRAIRDHLYQVLGLNPDDPPSS